MFQRAVHHHSHPLRLLVETDDPALAMCDFTTFVDAGFDVAVCRGPGGGQRCPVLEGDRCDLVEESDVVLNAFKDAVIQRAVVESVHDTSPQMPMVVTVSPGMDVELPQGCVPLSRVVSVSGQTQLLRKTALTRRAATSSHSSDPG